MAKIRSLDISAFRGARFPLRLDFSGNARSVAIFGDNASGKSTVTDAVEWFIHDRVAHLWREDCKQDALRHVLAGDDEVCKVELHFDGKECSGARELTADLKSPSRFSNNAAGDLVKILKDERIFLRHADIVEFLDQQKGRKREAIANIIGYEKITKFRTAIQQTLNSLKKDASYAGAKQQTDRLGAQMVKSFGQVIPNRKVFLEVAQITADPLSLKTKITDEASFIVAKEEIQGLGKSTEQIKALGMFSQLASTCDGIVTDIDQFRGEAGTYAESFNALVKERESVENLRLSEFLATGQSVIDSENYTNDACPFCLKSIDLSKLQDDVKLRLEKMSDIQARLDASKGLKSSLLQTITGIETKLKSLSETYKDHDAFADLISAADATLPPLRGYLAGIEKTFSDLVQFAPPDGFEKAISQLLEKCRAVATKAKTEADELGLSDRDQMIATTLHNLDILEEYLQQYELAQLQIDSFENQVRTISNIFDRFISVQNSALQAVLDRISSDVGSFYQALHPKENVDDVRLSMVGDEGVEFEYSFHGEPTQPPRKYLSESHLNSLGVVLFLANAKIFNKQANFIVLDDIVTSFDSSHRRRLLRLLRDEFSEWQIILLTHEKVWFDIIKEEMNQHGWLFKQVSTDDGANGIVLEDSPATLIDVIHRKRGREDVTNDLRKLLEHGLKNICLSLQVKLPFRFNEHNEQRMIGEMISHLRSTLKDKSPDMSKSQIFSELAGSTLVANLDSHDNRKQIVGEDIDVMLEDIEKFVKLFFCDDCGRYISADISIPGEKAISCKCNMLKIPWSS